MSRVCTISGKRPLSGHKVSHSNRKSKKRSLVNLQSKRYFVPSEGRWIRLRLSVAAMREIDVRGIDVVIAELRTRERRA